MADDIVCVVPYPIGDEGVYLKIYALVHGHKSKKAYLLGPELDPIFQEEIYHTGGWAPNTLDNGTSKTVYKIGSPKLGLKALGGSNVS